MNDSTCSIPCINLAERYGKRFKIGFDPAYDPFRVDRAKRDPWMMLVLCERGEICPDGGEFLRIDIVRHNGVANKIAAIPGVEMVCDGDHEKACRFHVDLFDAVAKLAKPRKRIVLSDEEKQRRSEMLKEFRFAKQTDSIERQGDPIAIPTSDPQF